MAKTYASSQCCSQNNLTNYSIINELLGKVKNKNILDAGCGDGYFSHQLKLAGAKVSACDGSKEFVNIAKQTYKEIDFSVSDLTKKLPHKSESFDIIVSSLVVMDIEKIDKFFAEAFRTLKHGGKFVFTIMHPCYFIFDWEKDDNGNKLFRKVDNYNKQTKKTLNFCGETTHYHRTLTWYTSRLKKAGFLIEEFKEFPSNKKAFENMKPHQKRVPLFLGISCVKI